jgi:hypothetical protein
MNFTFVSARAMTHARGLLFLVFLGLSLRFPLPAALSEPQGYSVSQCSGRAMVEVFPEWQAAYPNCSVVATVQNWGKPPLVSIMGEGCCDSLSPITVARILVTYPDCFVGEIYLVELDGGVVEVDLIDLF